MCNVLGGWRAGLRLIGAAGLCAILLGLGMVETGAEGGFTVVLRRGAAEGVVPPPVGSNELCFYFNGEGKIVGGAWKSNGIGVGALEHADGTPVSTERPADSARAGRPGNSGTGANLPRPGGWTEVCLKFDDTGSITGGSWVGPGAPPAHLGGLKAPDGSLVTPQKPLDTVQIGTVGGRFVVETGSASDKLPVKVVVPGVASDSSTGSPPAVDPPPSGGGHAPVIKSVGCVTPVKVGQPSFCQAIVEPGSPNDPVTLRYWEAVDGNPASSTAGSSFVTTFAGVGAKEVTLTACSGGGCSSAATTVVVEPAGPQPLTGSGTFTLFEQSGQCGGLAIAEILQLSLSLAPSGTSVIVNVTNKGWLGTFGTWTDEPGGKLLSATGQNLPNPPSGVTAYHFSIAGHYIATTKVLAWETASGFSLFYDRPGDQRCIARYSYDIQLN